jgi:hypothetical protein
MTDNDIEIYVSKSSCGFQPGQLFPKSEIHLNKNVKAIDLKSLCNKFINKSKLYVASDILAELGVIRD